MMVERQEQHNPELNLGRAVRQIREGRAKSLRSTARDAGVTPGLLSQIETGKTRPSVGTLFALARALDVPAGDFFSSVPWSGPLPTASYRVVRKSHRRQLRLASGVVWKSLTDVSWPGFRLVEICYPPGAVSAKDLYTHRGREFATVIEGELVFVVGGSCEVLGVGDSIWLDSALPHRLRNDTDREARSLALTIDPWPYSVEADSTRD